MSFQHLHNERGFLSDYFLGTVFAGRRRASDRLVDTALWRLRRLLERVAGRDLDATACRERFARPLLQEAFGFLLGSGSERIHALHGSAATEAAGSKPLALAWCGSADDDLDAGRGDGNPTTRLERALAAADVRYGLLITSERLRLVRAPGFGPRGAYLELDLPGVAESGDLASLGAALRLFGREAFEPGTDGRSPIEAIEEQSRLHAARVSEDLRDAVHRASESLVAGLIADALARGELADAAQLDDARLRLFRDAALTALYRLLFILYAEDRDERLRRHELYRENYSVHALVGELTRDPTRTWPENRSSLWARLLALFRIYDSGMPPHGTWERIPPRGGDLFRQDTAEGRVLATARLPDGVVARVVVDLATTAARPGVGRERVSFRELDIEQLGSVYEGLLDFEPRVAREPALELRVQGRTFVLAPEEVVRLCEAKSLTLAGDVGLVAGTVAERLHPDAQTDPDKDEDEEDDDEAAGEDEDGGGLKKGGVARLLRRIDPGTFHFVPGGARKGSGSFYTPRLLVQDVVRHALGPLVEGRTAAQIERLRVLDPACGSGHFLIEAMRFLARGLHRAYAQEHGAEGPPAFRSTSRTWDSDWETSDEAARAANSEARAWCKRRVAERCLFGVDRNPTAVNLAHVALWIESLAGDRPLTYFEHHVRCGNSLLGTWLDRLQHPPLPDLKGGVKGAEGQVGLFEQNLVRKLIEEAAAERRLIDERSAEDLLREGIQPESIDELRFKAERELHATRILATAKLLFDLRSASVYEPDIWRNWVHLASLMTSLEKLRAEVARVPWSARFEQVRGRERFFHWELEFPEVFLDEERRGFDAVIGNPPWDRVRPTRTEFYAQVDVLIRAFKGNELDARIRELHRQHPSLGDEYEAYQDRTITTASYLRNGGDFPWREAVSHNANEDVSKYFVDRAARLAGLHGAVGMIVPSTIYNGDGCLGLRRLLLADAAVERFYAFENRGDKARGIPKPFPIHSSYKFVSLVFRAGRRADGFDAAFMRHDLRELEDAASKPWLVRITREEVERLSPETLALLEYRGPRDQEIVGKMRIGRPALGGEEPGNWEVRLFRDRNGQNIFDCSRGRDLELFTDPRTNRLHSPESVLGRAPQDRTELLRAMAARGFLPVYEGKSVDQYLVGTKPIRWWLSVEQALAKYGKEPRREATVVFRETARNTDERTSIAAVLPADSAASHTLTGLLAARVEADAAVTVLDSFCFDWLLRLRAAGTHVSFTYILPLAVPPADVANRLPRIPTRLAWEAGLGHVTEDRGLWPLLWQANRAVAQAYGLSAEDFLHVLGTFPGVAKKRKEFFAWVREQAEAWREEPSAASALLVAEPPAGR